MGGCAYLPPADRSAALLSARSSPPTQGAPCKQTKADAAANFDAASAAVPLLKTRATAIIGALSAESNQWAGRPSLNPLIKYFQTKRGFARKTVPKRGEIDPKHPKSAFCCLRRWLD